MKVSSLESSSSSFPFRGTWTGSSRFHTSFWIRIIQLVCRMPLPSNFLYAETNQRVKADPHGPFFIVVTRRPALMMTTGICAGARASGGRPRASRDCPKPQEPPADLLLLPSLLSSLFPPSQLQRFYQYCSTIQRTCGLQTFTWDSHIPVCPQLTAYTLGFTCSATVSTNSHRKGASKNKPHERWSDCNETDFISFLLSRPLFRGSSDVDQLGKIFE